MEENAGNTFSENLLKCKTTLAIFNDVEFNEIVAAINRQLKQHQKIKTDLLNNFFIKTESLRKELESQLEISTAA
jgi:RNA-binding protein YhbY